ncbi:hypothetical protein B0T26DRAFT_330308 [Lasiosphaeria miniovina]|uniref:Uncharacterized protein n=1 Tax=Lasiosphaeria miniovina TaxID=1954250 RepID=A0AA40AM99_9PEZI|nr:uncharacterized protein B0T26DRAFT_330308 [Lasiosphaeria miniovina]KAK0718404.1 hypothetical protein B0T26DRAFT_330308 [Lasiosphaeria miniovina]
MEATTAAASPVSRERRRAFSFSDTHSLLAFVLFFLVAVFVFTVALQALVPLWFVFVIPSLLGYRRFLLRTLHRRRQRRRPEVGKTRVDLAYPPGHQTAAYRQLGDEVCHIDIDIRCPEACGYCERCAHSYIGYVWLKLQEERAKSKLSGKEN